MWEGWKNARKKKWEDKSCQEMNKEKQRKNWNQVMSPLGMGERSRERKKEWKKEGKKES